jgi:hypothetical protein
VILVSFLTAFILIGCTGLPPAHGPQESGEEPLGGGPPVVPEYTPSSPASFPAEGWKGAQGRSGPLSAAELSDILSSYLSAPKKPVTRNGMPLAFIRRRENGGSNTIIALAVRTEDTGKTSFSYVSDFQRLFDPGMEALPFSVEVFKIAADGEVETQSIEAGTYDVCSSFAELPFPASAASPYGVSLIFPDTEGRRNIWILFPGSPDDPQREDAFPLRHSFFSFYEQTNLRAFIQDIDASGIFDLLIFEDIFEDSSGYETYITWHKWNGTTFAKYRTTNIVRKLRAFFESSRQLLLSRSWNRFFDYALLPEDAKGAMRADAAEAFRRIFRLAENADPEDQSRYEFLFSPEVSRNGISAVVFPQVVENPFPLGKEGLESFPFTFRITANDENYFFSARLAINKNPFAGRMFHFLPAE